MKGSFGARAARTPVKRFTRPAISSTRRFRSDLSILGLADAADGRHHRAEPASTRERILAAAAECFAKEGYERARMVAVAERAGVSRAGLYLHFPTKEALLAGLNESVIDEWLALSERTLTADGPRSRRSRAGSARGSRARRSSRECAIVTADETQQALLLDRAATEQALAHTLRMLTAVLRRGVRQRRARARSRRERVRAEPPGAADGPAAQSQPLVS